MKVERMTEIETNDIHVGDRIRVGKYTATCTDIATPLFWFKSSSPNSAYLMKGVLFMEEVFAKYEDTAGNLHWHGTETGEHIIKKQDPLSNFQIPNKCKYCGYYYNFLCRAEQCIKDGVIT